MSCPSCQHENREGAAFCEACGTQLALACASCGNEVRAGARFCDSCGQPIAAAPEAEATPEPPARDPRDYTPRHLAERILTTKSAIEGERKQVTVLFADVKGSVDMSESVDAEQWHRLMDRFFQILSDGVHRFEGTVNQFTGDGIMALFGAPLAHEDHAQRACYAALHLQDELRRYADELRLEGLNFSVRMGLNSGDVVVGKIGDDLRMDYTAQGHTVGLAARMEQLAEAGRIYLTEHTASLVSGYFELRDLGPLKLRGVSQPTRVYELQGVGAVRTRLDISRARGLTRFVGRGSDLQTLQAALERAEQGSGQVVGVVAEAGVGKSRLCFEFAERCRESGYTVLQGHAVAHGKAIPFLPMLQIFRGYFGIEDHDGDQVAREKIAGRLLLLDEGFREMLPLVFDFLGYPDPERPLPPMDPNASRRQVFAVMRSVIQATSGRGRFLTLIEDLHWMDEASEALLAHWVDTLAGIGGMLLLNFRPEYRADWMQKSYYQQLPLTPLGPDAIRELLDDLLGEDASVAGLADSIHRRTAGNPFFIEEVVQSLIESGNLKGTRGSYRLVTPVESLDVPSTVQAVLAARIDRLVGREKQLLQAAAVIGKEFVEPILEAIAELPREDLTQSLASLKTAEFIYEQSLYPVAEYAFKHPLTQEVALRSQLQDRRQRIHAAVARAIIDTNPTRHQEHASLIAHHWEEAGEALEAARWFARAAERVAASDPVLSMRHWERVRALATSAPESPETDGLRMLACMQILARGAWRLGLGTEAVDELQAEGRELARKSGNVNVLVMLTGSHSGRLVTLGRVREAVEAAEEAARLAADGETSQEVLASVQVALTYTRYCAGRVVDALAAAERGIELCAGDMQLGRRIFGYGILLWFHGLTGMLRAELGELADVCEEVERRRGEAREAGEQEVLGWNLGNAGVLGDLMGLEATAVLGDPRANAAQAVEIAEKIGSPFSRVHAQVSVGRAHLLFEEWPQAREALERALEIAREGNTAIEFRTLTLSLLARALRGLGDLAAALGTAREAAETGRGHGMRGHEILAQLALAEVLRAGGDGADRAEAESALDAAEALVAATGARVYAPKIAEARARLADALGEAEAARRLLGEAQRLYAELGASGHAGRLAAELAD